jgi:hypothetical protein
VTLREKINFINLYKRFLYLRYKVTQYQLGGNDPPEYLLNELADVERTVRIISRALE